MYSKLIYRFIDHPVIERFLGGIRKRVIFLYLAWGIPLSLLVSILQEIGFPLVAKLFFFLLCFIWVAVGVLSYINPKIKEVIARGSASDKQVSSALNFIITVGVLGLALGLLI